jgi:hypothetical protein
MRIKSAQAVDGRGGTYTPFHYIYHHVQSCNVRYATAERADTLSLFLLYPYVYSVIPTSIQDLGLNLSF